MINNLSPISFQASDHVTQAIAKLGRTEDIHFSPDGNALAIASIFNNYILVINIDIQRCDSGISINLTDCFEIRSASLVSPHGVFWADNCTVAVANRSANVVFLKLPENIPESKTLTLEPSQVLDINDHIKTPGSLFIDKSYQGFFELLVCNNYAHTVSKHKLDVESLSIISSEILLKAGMYIPDGIAKSHDQEWIAISNHGGNCVFVYQNTESLNPKTTPDAILDGLSYPHGLRFSKDGEYLLVADAGQPYVYLYQKPCDRWVGLLKPILALSTMDEATFKRGQHNPMEGGPKGIDIHPENKILVSTSAEQSLVFFSIEQVLVTNHNKTNQLSSVQDILASEYQKLSKLINCLTISQEKILSSQSSLITALERELFVYQKRFTSRVRSKLRPFKLRFLALIKS